MVFTPRLASATLAFAALALALTACESTPQRPRTVTPVVRDVPAVLRGTVGAETTANGIDPTLVSGFGLVVGLNGTGGGALPSNVAATMEREMALNGISRSNNLGGANVAEQTPRQMLRDPNVAVVVVQAAVPPGAPRAKTFDVYVRALNATSLEGGTLWTSRLQLGPATTFGGYSNKILGEARGPIFVNPFVDPGSNTSGINESVGRVLNGGIITSPLKIELLMDNPSHSRVRAIVNAINGRFPESPGDGDQIARGRNDSSIALIVPLAYRDRAGDFIRIVQHITIDQSFPEEYARRFVAAVRREPAMGEDIAWCLEALGPRALPFIRELYEAPDIVPQMVGLQAGSHLGDSQAATALKQVARSGLGAARTRAIELLGEIDGGPTVDIALRDLTAEEELTVRIAAYEALTKRAERAELARQVAVRSASSDPLVREVPLTHLEVLAKLNLPPGLLQGVQRSLVEGKFLLDLVPFGDPMIYITQQGQPRIVIFGNKASIEAPALATAWSDRLLISADVPNEPVRVYYRDLVTKRAVTQNTSGDLGELVKFMAHTPTPEDPRPGLGLSYSEVVGALYAIHQSRATAAAFTTERDRLLADLLTTNNTVAAERPENEEERDKVIVFKQPSPTPMIDANREAGATKPPIEPLGPPTGVPPPK